MTRSRQIDCGETTFHVVNPKAALAMPSGIGKIVQLHPESVRDFVVRSKPVSDFDGVDETRHKNGKGSAGNVVEATEVLSHSEVQADFLSRLPLRGLSRVPVAGLHPAPRERDVARPGIAVALRPFDKQQVNRFLLLVQDHCNGGAGPVSGCQTRLISGETLADLCNRGHISTGWLNPAANGPAVDHLADLTLRT